MNSAIKFARRHKIAAVLLFLLSLELISLPVVWWRYSLRGFPFHAFVDDFAIPRWAFGWWIVPPIAENVPQKYVGNIGTRPSKWTEMFPADLIFGWRLAPNKIARHAFAPHYYVTNSQGFAVTERFDETYAIPKPANTYRVIVLGSSTILGAGVSDSRDALPAQILKNLRRTSFAKDKNIEVINAGVGGYTIFQEYLYLLTELIAYQPDLVVAYNGWAEAGLNGMFNAYGKNANPYRSFQQREIAVRLDNTFSVFGSALAFAGNVLVAAGDLWSGSAVRHIIYSMAHHAGTVLRSSKKNSDEAGSSEKFNPATASHFADLMSVMIDSAHRFGFRIALFLQPHSYVAAKPLSDAESLYLSNVLASEGGKADQRSLSGFYASVEPEIERIKNENRDDRKVCIGDVSDVFNATKETVYIDTGHLNRRGEEIVSARLIKEMTACNFFSDVR